MSDHQYDDLKEQIKELFALSDMQATFAIAYCSEAAGNATRAAGIAGYSHPGTSGWQNKNHKDIIEAMKYIREQLQTDKDILTPEDIHQQWARIALDPGVKPSDRLAALRDAARAHGMFGQEEQTRQQQELTALGLAKLMGVKAPQLEAEEVDIIDAEWTEEQ